MALMFGAEGFDVKDEDTPILDEAQRKNQRVRELVDLNEQLAASFKSIKEDPMDLNRLMMHVARMSHQLNELTKHVLIEV